MFLEAERRKNCGCKFSRCYSVRVWRIPLFSPPYITVTFIKLYQSRHVHNSLFVMGLVERIGLVLFHPRKRFGKDSHCQGFSVWCASASFTWTVEQQDIFFDWMSFFFLWRNVFFPPICRNDSGKLCGLVDRGFDLEIEIARSPVYLSWRTYRWIVNSYVKNFFKGISSNSNCQTYSR